MLSWGENQLRKKLVALLLFAGVMLVFCAFVLMPTSENKLQKVNELVASPLSDESLQDPGINSLSGFGFDDGIYVTPSVTPSVDNEYFGSVSAIRLAEGRENFSPTYTVLKMQNDKWEEYKGSDFRIEVDSSMRFVRWYLNKNAPSAVYGINCYLESDDEDIDEDFKILYAGEWNYINITNDAGERRIENFAGGEDLTLSLNVSFNDGAAAPELTGYGSLEDKFIVNTESMINNIVVKTLSGDAYSSKNIKARSLIDNRVEIRFTEPFGEDIYLVQFTAGVDNPNNVVGQFIIDNTSSKSGVNLSRLWVILMVVGGVLALGAASAYLVPVLIVKVNEVRVNKENERVARMKNPEAYVKKSKKTFKEVIDKIIYNIKTPVYKRKKETLEVEETEEKKEYTNRFTEMLRERKEKRDFMRENNVSSEEMERMKAREAEIALDEANSFAALRDDDDDEIATFHAAQEEVSTLETGAYVDNGARFAKLDSLRGEEVNSKNDVYGGSDNNEGNDW